MVELEELHELQAVKEKTSQAKSTRVEVIDIWDVWYSISVMIVFPFCSLFLIVHSFRLTTWKGNQHFINTAYLFVSSSPFFSLLVLPL